MSRTTRNTMIVFASLLLGVFPAVAQDGEMSPEAMMEAATATRALGEQHQELAEAAGTWKAAVKMWMDPSAEPMESEGTVERKMILGGRVLHETFTGNMMGQPFTGISHVGFDNVTQRYWSTWTDDMGTGVMVSWGTWDEKEKAVVYHGTSPDPMSGEMADMKIVIQTPEAGKEVMKMYGVADGQEIKWMEMHLTKQ